MTQRVRQTDMSRRFMAHVRALRRQQGLSQEELTRRSNGYAAEQVLTRANLANIEIRDDASVTLDVALALAGALGVSLTDLVEASHRVCPRCDGTPPAGFTCNVCGTVGSTA